MSDPLTYGGGARYDVALRFVLDYLDESIDAVIFVSDFIRVSEKLTNDLFFVAHKYETIGIMVKDRLDMTFPDIDREVVLEDPITKQQILVNPKRVKKIYEKRAFAMAEKVKSVFKQSDIDLLELTTDVPFAFNLAEFLGERAEAGKIVT